MKIRTVTLGICHRQNHNRAFENSIKSFFEITEELFSKKNFTLRTKRISLDPATLNNPRAANKLCSSVKSMSALCRNTKIRWFCVPLRVFGQNGELINDCAVKIADKQKNAFINYIVTDNNRIDRKAVFYASRFIKSVATLSDNGLDNFRCGVSFNCRANGAFFPFTYHEGKNGFSVSLEIVPLFVEIIKSNKDKNLEQLRNQIMDKLVTLLKQVESICLRASKVTAMRYFGTDVSLAPHPEEPEHSVAFLIELLGVELFGGSGTTFMTSYLTDIVSTAINQSGITTTGFNGVMYSMLEDQRLGEINNKEQSLSIDSLLAFSTVCGCGIDMVPVPGDISEQKIASIMLDISAIAIRLNKPLGVRLLPIPGKCAGEFTELDHDFLHNTRVQNLKNAACKKKMFEVDGFFAYLQNDLNNSFFFQPK